MYSDFSASFNETRLVVKFPAGSSIQHKTCNHDRDLKNFDGGQYSLVVWDEVQWHSKNQISYLFSRVRSKAEGPHQVLATCNPHPDAAVRPFVEWYLDQNTGIPLPERSGVVRYFAEYRGDFVFGDTPEELKEKYSPNLSPQTYTFISANIYSNPILMARDSQYVARLENLKRSERARLLEGSWYVRESTSKLVRAEDIVMVDHAPTERATRVRCWDFAYTLPSETNRDPDFTASVMMSRTADGIYTIEHAWRDRKQASDHVKEVVKMAEYDGPEVQVFIPRESGPGKAWSQNFTRELIEQGINARPIVISGHSGKLSKFKPFAALCGNGNIRMVRAPWNDWLLAELEGFDGTRNSGGVHDDGLDCVSDCTIQLSRSATLPVFTLPNSEFTKSSPIQ